VCKEHFRIFCPIGRKKSVAGTSFFVVKPISTLLLFVRSLSACVVSKYFIQFSLNDVNSKAHKSFNKNLVVTL